METIESNGQSFGKTVHSSANLLPVARSRTLNLIRDFKCWKFFYSGFKTNQSYEVFKSWYFILDPLMAQNAILISNHNLLFLFILMAVYMVLLDCIYTASTDDLSTYSLQELQLLRVWRLDNYQIKLLHQRWWQILVTDII